MLLWHQCLLAAICLSSPVSEYNVYWEEVGNAAGNNSGGAISVNSAQYVINFGSPGTYRVGIEPVGSNPFDSFSFAATGDDKKLITVERWGNIQWGSFAGMFNGASNLTTVSAADAPDMTTAVSAFGMFQNTTALASIAAIDTWDTSNIQNMGLMFYGSGIGSLPISNWDTSSVYNMHSMFRDAVSANPQTANWDTSTVSVMVSLFENTSVANPETANWDTSSVTSMASMFKNAVAASPATANWDTSSVTNMTSLFQGAANANPDVSAWLNMYGMFFQAVNANPDVAAWNTSSVTSISWMFAGATSANPDVGGWDTSSMTSMEAVFQNASSANPDVSGWDTSLVTNMNSLFNGAIAAVPDVSNWDTSNVENMRVMFGNTTLANPDVSAWDTSSVTNIEFMFTNTALANPDVTAWDTSLVTSMHGTFYDAANASPDVSGWDTANVTNMIGTFQNSGFTGALDSWDFTSVTALNVFLTGVTLSQSNYDNLLLSLDTQVLNSGVVFSAGNNTYCLGEGARANLIASNNWTVIDLGKDCEPVILSAVLEDSSSVGGANNGDGTPVTVQQLSELPGIANVNIASEVAYQAAIAAETGFSNPPTVEQVQVVIEMLVQWVNTEFHRRIRIIKSNGKRSGTKLAIIVAVTFQ